MVFGVWAICQISRSQWMSREGSYFPPSLCSFFFCNFWCKVGIFGYTHMGNLSMSLTECGGMRFIPVLVPEELQWFPCWIPFSPWGYFQLTVKEEQGREGGASAVEALGVEPLCSQYPCGFPAPTLQSYPCYGSHGASQMFLISYCLEEDISLLRTDPPSSSFFEI